MSSQSQTRHSKTPTRPRATTPPSPSRTSRESHSKTPDRGETRGACWICGTTTEGAHLKAESAANSALLAELRQLKPSQLKKRAVAAGSTAQQIEDAEDADDTQAALMELIMAAEEVESAANSALLAELRQLKPSQLKKRAVAAGSTAQQIEDAEDADDTQAALMELIMAAEEVESAANSALLAELRQLKPSQLKKRAVAAGSTAQQIEDAEDADDTREALISLIVVASTGQASALHMAAPPHSDTTAMSGKDELIGAVPPGLVAELSALKLGVLTKRVQAEETIEEHAIVQALDEHNPKAALIDLLVRVSLSSASKTGADRARLQGMKLGALSVQAKERGLSETVVQDALDTADPKTALIDMLLQPPPAAPTTTKELPGASDVHIPHFGDGAGKPHTSIRSTLSSLEKHIMLSYQWDHQEQVKAVYEQLVAAGVPVWMDISGGMAADIFDSMAEGVTHAACIVCFMTQKYQDSVNCKMELKFGQQNGVPIVPVMMEGKDSSGRSWKPSSWLGLLTAGILYIPMHDIGTFDDQFQQLLRQIDIATKPETDVALFTECDEDGLAAFTAEDSRQELERLVAEDIAMGGGNKPSTIPGGMCSLPAQVPALPTGMRVSAETNQLLRLLLTPSIRKRTIAFVGMGGAGKTTVSAYLARNKEVRKKFSQVVWVAIGQEPNIDQLQTLMMWQLMGKKFESTDSPEEKQEQLKQAMAGKNILLVVDDLWERRHRDTLDFTDVEAACTVLISSRNREVLDGAELVDIGLPTDTEAIEMLLSVAGIVAQAPEVAIPDDAVREVVRFCNNLPLAIGIAGKLIASLRATGGLSDDWSEVLDLLQEEFSDDAVESKSMEERIIRTSLNAIKGPHRENMLALMNSFAAVPEDASVPLEIVVMLFMAERGLESRQTTLLISCRRWLKALIDRSLILGTVDNPSLHDIVKEFVVSSKEPDALRKQNRRLIELWRSERPQGGWQLDGTDSVSRYITGCGPHHMQAAWAFDKYKDDTEAIDWLSDFTEANPVQSQCKQDAIPILAALTLGHERVTVLCEQAEAEGDFWVAALRWSAAALAAGRVGGYNSMNPLDAKALKCLERVQHSPDSTTTTCTRQQAGRLELCIHLRFLSSYVDVERRAHAIARVKAILADDPEAGDEFSVITFEYNNDVVGHILNGTADEMGPACIPWCKRLLGFLQDVHASDVTRRCQIASWIVWCACMESMFRAPDFEWSLFGENGDVLMDCVRQYNYKAMTRAMHTFPGFDIILAFPGYLIVPVTHLGNLKLANEAVDRLLPSVYACLDDWNPSLLYEILFLKTLWPWWLYVMGRKEDARTVLHAGPYEGCLEKQLDYLADHGAPGFYKARGTTSSDGFCSIEDLVHQAQHMAVLFMDDKALQADRSSLLANLPPRPECLPGLLTNGAFSVVPAMLARERLGDAAGAMEFAEMITSGSLGPGLGSNKLQYSLAYCSQARFLASQGKPAEAEEAFESAISAVQGVGYNYFTALHVDALGKCVLNPAGRGAENADRLEAALSGVACGAASLQPLPY